MIILIPMAGLGSRFVEAGYRTNKASIPIIDRHTGQRIPMVVAAMKDIPGIYEPHTRIICIDREVHKLNGTEQAILQSFPNTVFIHDTVLLDQAYGCYLAKEYLEQDQELFVGCCDCGMSVNLSAFNSLKSDTDALMFSHTNTSYIEDNPYAHSWAVLRENQSNELISVSLKNPISNQPLKDHATTGDFWFRSSREFLEKLELMIQQKDTLNGKFYIDKLLNYYISSNLKVRFLDVKYLCWGTPIDYENYEQTYAYWERFLLAENLLNDG